MWRGGNPDVDGRYFVMVNMFGPGGVISALPMASNFRDGKWCGLLPDETTVTHWMEIPGLDGI